MKQYTNIRTEAKGFTLIELLVVIAIIGVLAAVVLLAINPAELLRRSRDSTRFSDLSTVRKAIDAATANQSADTSTNAIRWGITATGAAAACTSGSVCNSVDNTLSSNGSGYVPLNITGTLSTLPRDPRNGSTTNVSTGASATGRNNATARYFFRWDNATETYTLATYVESSDNWQRIANDGGNLAYAFETGTAFLLTTGNVPAPAP